MGVRDRLHNLGLPPDIVNAANTHREMPADIRPLILKTIKELKQQHHGLQELLAYEYNYGSRYSVEDCEEQLRPIVQKLRACHGLLSSMRKIPNEVLARIFEYYLAPGGVCYTGHTKNSEKDHGYMYYTYSDDENDDEDVELRTPRPGLLCLVCRHWNAVASATPSLWTTSSFVINAQEQKPGKYPLVTASHAHGISVWLDRVASRPWSLVVNAYGRRGYWGGRSTASDSTVELSKLLKGPALQQLQRVLIKVEPFALGMGEVTFPSVSSIVVCSDIDEEPVRNKKPVFPDLPSLPALTQAVFEGVLPPRKLPLHIPWSQLTHLFLGEMVPIRQWQGILKLCTSLQVGCFDLFDYDPKDPKDAAVYPQPDTATLTHLTDLVCIHSSPFGEGHIEGVNMPSLKSLKLLLDNSFNCIWDLDGPIQFPCLTHLTLIDEETSGDLVVEIMKLHPQLQELFVLVAEDFDSFFDYLTFKPGNFNMPSLQALGLYIKTRETDDDDTYDSEEDEWEDEDSESEVELTFPNQALASFVASRTKAIQENAFSSAPQNLSALKQLVIHAADFRNESHESVKKIKEAVAPFVPYGLNAFVFSAWPHNRPAKMRRMGGKPPAMFGHYKHWDEGFMEVVDGVEEYSLYPKSQKLL